MISSLQLKNFKSIKSKLFPLRNLNILLGLNGQGKSSFIQALLLLRQSEKPDLSQLRLQGGETGLVNIGTANDLLYQFTDDDFIDYEIKFQKADSMALRYAYEHEADIVKAITPLSPVESEIIIDEALFTNRFQYLTAQRVEPKSGNATSSSSVMEGNSIGKYGQYTAHFLELRGNEDIAFTNTLHDRSKTIETLFETSTVSSSLISQVNLWLNELSPGVSVHTKKISSDIVLLEYEFVQPTLGKTNRFKPENVGFGISYALHVVTALLSAKEGGLVIIENPESHIHPRGQVELGRLIALVADNDVQVIIETHSDHLLNGIRVGIKQQKLDCQKAIAFYFQKVIEETEQYSDVLNIEFDAMGELSDYPKGLLDEWSTQLMNLM